MHLVYTESYYFIKSILHHVLKAKQKMLDQSYAVDENKISYQ